MYIEDTMVTRGFLAPSPKGDHMITPERLATPLKGWQTSKVVEIKEPSHTTSPWSR